MIVTNCKDGNHCVDNQGLCHWCGILLNPEWWSFYVDGPAVQQSNNELENERVDSHKEDRTGSRDRKRHRREGGQTKGSRRSTQHSRTKRFGRIARRACQRRADVSTLQAVERKEAKE